MLIITVQKIINHHIQSFTLFWYFWFWFPHKFQTKGAHTFAHDLKKLFSPIEFTVKISSKSFTTNSVIFSFLSYFGWY